MPLIKPRGSTIRLDQLRLDQTRIDRMRFDQTRFDQIRFDQPPPGWTDSNGPRFDRFMAGPKRSKTAGQKRPVKNGGSKTAGQKRRQIPARRGRGRATVIFI